MGIRQLASELQLSIGTVSRALNDRPDVNPDTRARVKAAAARGGLRARPVRAEPTQRPDRHVAAVIPTRGFASSSDSGLFTVLEGARRALRPHALDLIVLFRGPDEDPLENLQRIVQRRIADGVIISGTVGMDPRIAYLKAAAWTTSPSAAAPGSTTIRSWTSTSRRWPPRRSGSSSRTAIAGWRWPPTNSR